jgi:hypothetical protein
MEHPKMPVDAEAGYNIGENSAASKSIFAKHLVAPEVIYRGLLFKRMQVMIAAGILFPFARCIME